MDNNGFASLRTAHEIIQDFQKEKKIVYRPDRSNSKMHWVFINDQDKFGKIYDEISGIEKLANNLTFTAVRDISIMKKVKYRDRNIPDNALGSLLGSQFRNLIHMAQLAIYGRITAVVTAIEQDIKSNDDRESLYLRLPNILTASNKLNIAIIPEVISAYRRDLNGSAKKHHVVTGSLYARIITGITSIMSSNRG
jgi:hypothetical protein